MKSKGCPICSEESKQKNRRSKTEDLVNKLYSVHRNNIKYVNVDNYVNTETKMMFKCYKSSHGTFESTTHSVLGGRGCPVCKMSSGERKILFWLKDNKIKHEYQYRIRKTPKSKYFFIFDFYLPEKKMFIEYDGRQHYESIDVWGGDSGLEKRKKDDRLKNIISEKLGCKMLRIPYSNKNKIDKILTNEVGL